MNIYDIYVVIFVAQDDVVMGTLTVRENLMFSANLRLPSSLSKKDKRQRVEETLQELGLTSCADTKVSHTYLRRGGYIFVGFYVSMCVQNL